MAETAKRRTRLQPYNIEIGELVSVDGTFFDDLTQPVEQRYSTTLTNGRVNGRVKSKTQQSYTIRFEDGSTSSIPKDRVELVPFLRKGDNVVTTSNEPEQSDSDNDADYQPESETESDTSEAEEIPATKRSVNTEDTTSTSLETEEASSLKEGQEVYLCWLGKDIFKATYQGSSGDVHGKELDDNHGRFFILKSMKDASKWNQFDPDVHLSGSVVMWKLTDIRRMMRTPFSELGTEANFATPLPYRKRKRNEQNWQKNKKKRW